MSGRVEVKNICSGRNALPFIIGTPLEVDDEVKDQTVLLRPRKELVT